MIADMTPQLHTAHEHQSAATQAVLEVYASHDIAIKPHVLLALVLYKIVDQVSLKPPLQVH